MGDSEGCDGGSGTQQIGSGGGVCEAKYEAKRSEIKHEAKRSEIMNRSKLSLYFVILELQFQSNI